MFQLPRGTRDFIPDEMARRRFLEGRMAQTFQQFGYGEIQTPTFESLELFTAKSGASIVEELYSFTDKGGRELTLRPELTAPVMRCYVERLQMDPKPLKLYYIGNCFRYDRPQKGRYREFWQAGCELVGTDTTEAHAELIALAYTILRKSGLRNIALHIGNLVVISAMFERLALDSGTKKDLLTFIDKSQFEDVFTALRVAGASEHDAEEFCQVLQTSDIERIAAYVTASPKATEELGRLRAILELLQASYGITDATIKMSIVRGLDYYKGTVFEIEAPVLGAEKQLCGGGAYELVGLFGGTEVPTAGFAIGFDRTLLALEAEQCSFPSGGLDAFIVPVSPEVLPAAIAVGQTLRDQGLCTDIDLLRRGVGKALKYAGTRRARYAVIIGPKELEQQMVTLRNMDDGSQELVKTEALAARLCR